MNIGLHAVSLEIETQKSGDMKHHVTSCNDELANTSETPWNIHMFDTWHTQLACNMFCFLEQDLQFIYTHQRCVLFDAEGSVRGQAGSATHNKWEDSTCSMAEQKWPRHWPYCWRWFEILLAFSFCLHWIWALCWIDCQVDRKCFINFAWKDYLLTPLRVQAERIHMAYYERSRKSMLHVLHKQWRSQS